MMALDLDGVDHAMDLDTARLRAFVQVAERGTVAAAATALGFTAPAVSQQITKLEAQLGSLLFDRVGGRLRLSPGGERLLPIARELLDLTAQVPPAVRDAPIDRPVVIAGFASAIAAYVVPLLERASTRRTPFVIHEEEDRDALRDLGLGQVDLAIVQEYDGVPAPRSDRFRYTTLSTDRLRLLAPPHHPPSVQLRELATAAWLVNGAGTRCEQATQVVLRDAGIEPRITGRVSDNSTLLALVAAGHGATIAPELVIAGATIPITVARVDLHARRTILAVTRAGDAARHRELVRALRPAKAPGTRAGTTGSAGAEGTAGAAGTTRAIGATGAPRKARRQAVR